MWFNLVLLIFVTALVAAHTETNQLTNPQGKVVCERVPSSLWCSCDKLAAECGFTELCDKYNRASYNEPIWMTLLYENDLISRTNCIGFCVDQLTQRGYFGFMKKGLCPDCQNFISEFFRNAYPKIKDFIQLELVPYGNARREENSTIVCQHGESECNANRYESCAIHYMPEPLPFIYCLEIQLQNQVDLEKAARKCYSKFHTVPHIYDQIVHCYNGKQGIDLQMKAAKRTEELWPDVHQGVPWMLFNNISLKSQQFLMRDLNAAICQWYVGDKQPKGCGGLGADML